MKVCKKCEKEKELTEFYKNSKSGNYLNTCKKCNNKSSSEYYIMNKDLVKEYKKNWRKNNIEGILEKEQKRRDGLTVEEKESMKEYYKKWSEDNKEKLSEDNKEYYNKNKEYIKEKSRLYRKNNIEKIKKYRLDNKEQLNQKRNQKRQNRLKEDIIFSLESKCRKLISETFIRSGYSKNSKTFEILGCTFEEFKKYLESKFEDWMTWDNRGLYNGELNYGWDIDHKIPISSAKNIEDVIKLNHYTNLQPLCSYTNRYIKRDNY